MSIRYAILGFLSWRPFTGYDLKKVFARSQIFHWSGNSNQIYRALVQLHRDELVDLEVQQQDSLPARKVYTITAAGRDALAAWLRSAPTLPAKRSAFLVQLAWADQLAPDALGALLDAYAEEVRLHLLMSREMQRRGSNEPARTPREALLWRLASEYWSDGYEAELVWVRKVRAELAALDAGGAT